MFRWIIFAVFLSVNCVNFANCVEINHDEVESAFNNWFDEAFKFERANQSYDLSPDATEYENDYAQSHNHSELFKLSRVTFNIYRFVGSGHFVLSNRVDGIHLSVTDTPVRVLYKAESTGDVDTPPFSVCGGYGRRLAIVSHRERADTSNMELDTATLNKYNERNEFNGDDFKYKSFKVCSELDETRKEQIRGALDMRTFWDKLRPIVTGHVKNTWEKSNRTIIVKALHDLFKFENVDIYHYDELKWTRR